MNKTMSYVICAGLIMIANGINAEAAKTTSNKAKKSAQADAESMQCQEVKLQGVFSLKEVKFRDALRKAYFLTDSKGTDWEIPANKNVKFPEFEGLKVKATCMAMGSKILSLKAMEAVDKNAHAAKIAALEAEKKAAAAAKKAAAPAAPQAQKK